MGNYADAEMLLCDEHLDDIKCMEGWYDRVITWDEVVPIENTLKPQHLMFDGLDEEYNNFNDWCINLPSIQPKDEMDWSHLKLYSDDEIDDEENHYWNDYNDAKDGYDTDDMNDLCEYAAKMDLEDKLTRLNQDSYSVDNYCKYRKGDLELKDAINNAMNVYSPGKIHDIYMGLYYENMEHSWSLPERDEMDDLQEKVDDLNMDDYYDGLTVAEVNNLHC